MREDFAWLQENVFEAAPAVFPPAVFSWDAYVEAHAIAFSRCSILTGKDAVRPALLPLVDLANHAPEPCARIEPTRTRTRARTLTRTRTLSSSPSPNPTPNPHPNP